MTDTIIVIGVILFILLVMDKIMKYIIPRQKGVI